MTFAAYASRTVLSDSPCMGLMAVHAVQALLHMEPVLPDGSLVFMALTCAGSGRRTYFAVRFMALVAEKARHGTCPRYAGMALGTPVFGYHGRCFFRKRMAFETGKRLHADPMHTLVLMATLAGALIRAEIMQSALVACLAFDPLHKDMPRMSVRFVHRH